LKINGTLQPELATWSSLLLITNRLGPTFN